MLKFAKLTFLAIVFKSKMPHLPRSLFVKVTTNTVYSCRSSRVCESPFYRYIITFGFCNPPSGSALYIPLFHAHFQHTHNSFLPSLNNRLIPLRLCADDTFPHVFLLFIYGTFSLIRRNIIFPLFLKSIHALYSA